ncbi:MAG: amidohydrolase, partial [Actinomycetota bacterium]|nr:amidohydrolase [Actinomycetota bacterium]
MTTAAAQGLIDHHCHGVILRDLGRPEFEAMLNEAVRPSPLGTSLFDSMIGLAVRRWCAPVLDLDPLAEPEEYLAQRRALGVSEVTRRFLRATNTECFLVDTGYSPDAITGPDELAGL